MTVPLREPIKVVAEILQSEMGIAAGQIMLGLENYKIPQNEGLYVALFYGPDVVIGSNNDFVPETNEEVQTVALLHTIVIQAMSFDESARVRKEEIVMALGSIHAQQSMELNLMRLGMVPQTFLPVPELEETKQLNKFQISITLNALHQKVKAAEYFDDFPTPTIVTNA